MSWSCRGGILARLGCRELSDGGAGAAEAGGFLGAAGAGAQEDPDAQAWRAGSQRSNARSSAMAARARRRSGGPQRPFGVIRAASGGGSRGAPATAMKRTRTLSLRAGLPRASAGSSATAAPALRWLCGDRALSGRRVAASSANAVATLRRSA